MNRRRDAKQHQAQTTTTQRRRLHVAAVAPHRHEQHRTVAHTTVMRRRRRHNSNNNQREEREKKRIPVNLTIWWCSVGLRRSQRGSGEAKQQQHDTDGRNLGVFRRATTQHIREMNRDCEVQRRSPTAVEERRRGTRMELRRGREQGRERD